ncbi:fungal-specific transcription factor domain-containing protein [Dactylonectria estremocensis]|uniref:Fungal-specific transcription factor domain-containing protein n=1 Tax=Dactylonectria estremocensis TaxID=1079267 RepID=A0A9P9FDH6_9HYPO|nr:fungal-specific transcription factor domain-containing protein [Dactylonectria estremocensis]
MPPSRSQRSSGACLQCSRRKRRCDHKHPQCSQCLKHNVVCQPQTFKAWSVPASRGQQTRIISASGTQSSNGDRKKRKTGPEEPSETPRPPSEPPVATPDLAIELPIHDRPMTLRPSPSHTLESGIFDDAAWLSELLEIPSSRGQDSPNELERPKTSSDCDQGLVISPSLREQSLAPTNLPAVEFPMQDGQIALGRPSPSNTLQPGMLHDASWLEQLPQVPLTPCSEAFQIIQPGRPDTPSNYANADTYDLTTIAEIDTPVFSGQDASSSFNLDTYDPVMSSSVNNSWPTMSEIPAILYCPMPWPADMLVSAPRRFLWQHFLHITRSGFLCLDQKHFAHMQDFQDPFIVTLPRMALFDDDLRTAMFYFSAFQYQATTRDPKFMSLMRETARDASRAVVPYDMVPESNDERLLAKITVGLFLHLYGPDQRETHLKVAWGLAGTFLRHLRQRKRVTSISARLILALLRWSRIAMVCSLRQPKTYLSQSTYDMLEMDEDEISQNFCADFQNWTSHPVLAFSPRLINPLLRLGQLLELQQSKWTATGILEPPDPAMESQIEELEGLLLNARTRDLITSQGRSADPIELSSLNDSMHSAAAILLYSRLKGMPSTATLIRHHVSIVVGRIFNINHNSRVSYALVFPLFTAGCEAVDSGMRAAIVRRLRALKGLFYNRGDLVGALRQIWEIRDNEPGLTWLEWLEKIPTEFRIWCLF